MKKYKHVIITGPSFVGKTTIGNLILKTEKGYVRCITATTRPKRNGEENAKDYFFFSEEKFLDLDKKDFFIETNPFLKNDDGTISTLYGTPKSFVHEHKDKVPILFVVDPNGAEKLKKYLSNDAVTVFIAPPSFDALVDRINKRRTTETDKEITKRLKLAKEQMEKSNFFDYCLINEEGLEKAQELASKIISLASF